MAPNNTFSDEIIEENITPPNLRIISSSNICSGEEKHCEYESPVLNARIKFTVYIPGRSYPGEKFPALFFLPGIGANERNFLLKTGYQKHADEYRLIVVGTDIKPDVEIQEQRNSKAKSCDPWYMDTLTETYSPHFQMYSFVTSELPNLVLNNFPTNGQNGICGHSMGGHGALVCGLRNPDLFKSISAFAPACNPLAWGQANIFRKLLGDENKEKWFLYDSCALAKTYSGPERHILVDQGLDDFAMEIVCHPKRLIEASKTNPEGRVSVNVRMHPGFGHSSDLLEAHFEDHFKHHSQFLNL